MTDEDIKNQAEETAEEVKDEAEETIEAGESAFKDFVHHQRIAIEELGKAIESLFPKDFRDHTRKAGEAFIESFRKLFESARDDLEGMMNRQKDGEEEGKSAEGSKVKVDIE
ncbi:MAG: hypothetical protein GYB66_15720 [Chloroflexi bacterium]|nr:hypothetical protein [Chloroflexota bacterium]